MAPEHNFNKNGSLICRSTTDETTNQISRLWFQTSFLYENLFLAHVTLICNGLEPFEQLFKRAIYGSFLPSFVKIQPEVLKEMSFEAIDATDDFLFV